MSTDLSYAYCVCIFMACDRSIVFVERRPQFHFIGLSLKGVSRVKLCLGLLFQTFQSHSFFGLGLEFPILRFQIMIGERSRSVHGVGHVVLPKSLLHSTSRVAQRNTGHSRLEYVTQKPARTCVQPTHTVRITHVLRMGFGSHFLPWQLKSILRGPGRAKCKRENSGSHLDS
jgi:hypothetical protein